MPATSFFSANKNNILATLTLFVICLIGYWPLTFHVFSVKNDAIHYFLPFRYNISCAVQNGELPLWSPFIYLGYPVHGDMQSGSWNPFVLIISLFTKYNLTVFHFEYLFYLFLGGLGMYRLSGVIVSSFPIRLFIAISYMLCGYNYGSGQFVNWLASSTFVPFVVCSYYRFLATGSRYYSIETAVFGWLLLVCGYPADVLYTFYILLAMLIVAAWRRKIFLKRDKKVIAQYTLKHGLMVVLFMGLSLPALISYFELLPFYERGSALPYSEAITNSFEPKNIISLFDPWVVWTRDFSSFTDPTGRNLFIGIISLPLFALSFFNSFDLTRKFLFILLVISFLFCLGDSFFLRRLLYDWLPGMSEFRHPSHFRLYVIIPFLLLAGYGLDSFAVNSKTKIFRYTTFAFIIILSIFSIVGATMGAKNFFQDLPTNIYNGHALKTWLDSITFRSALTIGCLLQIIFLITMLLAKRKRSKSFLLVLNILNLLVFQALFPVNFVSKTNPKVIDGIIENRTLHQSDDQFFNTLGANSHDAADNFTDAGLAYFYNGRIGISKITNSPSFLTSQKEFLSDHFLYRHVASKPAVYFSDRYLPLSDSLQAKDSSLCNYSFTGARKLFVTNPCRSTQNKFLQYRHNFNSFNFEIYSADSSILNLTQNFQPGWKAEIDHRPATIVLSNHAFMSITVPAGNHQIDWVYHPRNVYFGIYIFLVAFAYLLFIFLKMILQRKK